MSFYLPAVLTAALTLGTLSVFRVIEYRMPTQYYALHVLRFARAKTPPEAEVRQLIAEHGFSIANMSYRLTDGGGAFEYRMTIKTLDKRNAARLAERLRGRPDLLEFRISPTGD